MGTLVVFATVHVVPFPNATPHVSGSTTFSEALK
jgi:hypothetical protein